MGKHDYTPQEALELLVRKLRAGNPQLSDKLEAAVNAGKDVQEWEPPRRGRRKKGRSYRRTVPYSPEDALRVSLDVLAAYFIEQPLFVNSLLDNMAQAAVGIVDARYAAMNLKHQTAKLGALDVKMRVDIELHTETELLRGSELARQEPETQPIGNIPIRQIEQQQGNFATLRALFDFGRG